MEKSNDLKPYYRIALYLSGAMIGSLVVYLIAVEIIRSQLKPFMGFAELANAPALRYGFYLAAVLVVILMRLLRGILFRRIKVESVKDLLRRLLRVSALTAALSEVPALLGLVLFLLAGYNRDFYILLAVSLILQFMYFPRSETWRSWLEENRPPGCCA